MILKKIFLLLLALGCFCSLSAQRSTIKLENGESYYGYIAVQRPGSYITIHTIDADGGTDYNVEWSEILKITKSETDLQKESLLDEVILNNGECKRGWIVEQYPGKRIAVKNQQGKVFLIPQAMIRATRKLAVSGDGNLWHDRPYTNEIELTDGSTRKGIIVYQQLGKKLDDCYIEILTASGATERIYSMDIKIYRCLLR